MHLVKLSVNHDDVDDIYFRSGLNLVVADKATNASNTDTRNGVGKTTFLQVVDYCLGGNVLKKDSLYRLKGDDWDFLLTVRLDDGGHVEVQRSLNGGPVGLSGELRALGFRDSKVEITQTEWKKVLGEYMFRIESNLDKAKYRPSFRQLFSHFWRFRDDAYLSPFETRKSENPWQTQVANSFLMGFDYELAGDWQVWKDNKSAVGSIANKEVDKLGEGIANFDSQLLIVEHMQRRIYDQIDNFEILPTYRDIKERANDLSNLMRDLANESVVDARLLELYSSELDQGLATTVDEILQFYSELNIVFGENIVRSLEEVEAFHSQVSRNRRDFLQIEISKIRDREAERSIRLADLERERSSAVRLLESTGAIEDLVLLQNELTATEVDRRAIEAERAELRQRRREINELRHRHLELQARTDIDIEGRSDDSMRIFSMFTDILDVAYGEPASLSVESSESGFKFSLTLPRQSSHAVGKAAIFAYDFAVLSSLVSRGFKIRFLAHDSIVFDGVDERQVAALILYAAAKCDELNVQYILTMNTDALPSDYLLEGGLNYQDYVIAEFSDKDPSRAFLGLRF